MDGNNWIEGGNTMQKQWFNKVKVEKSGSYPDIEHGYVQYEEREDGWYIKKEDENEWRKYARKVAGERDVRQLIFKDYCQSYGGEWEE